MPYIPLDQRPPINVAIDQALESIHNSGQLNYAITRLILGVLRREGKSYAVLNTLMGVLECAKQEFYRTQAVPYEEEKRAENGDV